MEYKTTESQRLRAKEYAQTHKEQVLAYRKWYNKEYAEKRAAYQRSHYANNKTRLHEARRVYGHEWRRKRLLELRAIVFAHYGNKCACPKCPETNHDFFTIDHITKKARDRDKGKRGISLYTQLIRLGFPDDVRLQCINCNWGREKRGKDGICPHML
jgi:hypothetical protein